MTIIENDLIIKQVLIELLIFLFLTLNSIVMLNIIYWDNQEQEQVVIQRPLTSRVELNGAKLYIDKLLISEEVGDLEIFIS